MRPSPFAAVAVLLAVLEPSGAASGAGGWQVMAYHDFRTPSSSDPLQTLVWPDAIRDANAYATDELRQDLGGRNALLTAVAAAFRDGARTIIVSAALTRDCDSGANDKTAGIEPSTCPVRIATIVGGKLADVKTVSGCYVDHADPDLPPQNRDDAAFARFDPAAGTVALRARIGGRDVRTCAQTYSIR